MATPRLRKRIAEPDVIDMKGVDPTAGIVSISGVRIHDIGQGDSISVLDGQGIPFMQIDYGGRVGNPYAKTGQTDSRMPIASGGLLMLSHWDEDHWCSAPHGTDAQAVNWLVPRQITSPRAVEFSSRLARIQCVPESKVGKAYSFATVRGDLICWEKIAAGPTDETTAENCNETGIGFSIVKKGRRGRDSQVILLPGDAPFDAISHYADHSRSEKRLRGMVAFHHGTNQHWTSATRSLLSNWARVTTPVDLVFSCAANNSYGHPHTDMYDKIPYKLDVWTTPQLRAAGRPYHDILFDAA